MPGPGVVQCKHPLQGPIKTFHQPVCLGVVDGNLKGLDPQRFPKVSQHFAYDIFTLVLEDLLGQPYSCENGGQILHQDRGQSTGEGYCFELLGSIIN